MFILLSTIILKPLFVGKFGNMIGVLNFSLFGYFAYFIPIYFGAVGYAFYKKMNQLFFERLFIIAILLITFLILQALLFEIGSFGIIFVNSLKPIIGLIGIILLLFTIFSILYFMIKLHLDNQLLFDFSEKNREKVNNSNTETEIIKLPEEKQEIVLKEKEENEETINEQKDDESKEKKIEKYIEEKLKEIRVTDDIPIDVVTKKIEDEQDETPISIKIVKKEENKGEEISETLKEKIEKEFEKVESNLQKVIEENEKELNEQKIIENREEDNKEIKVENKKIEKEIKNREEEQIDFEKIKNRIDSNVEKNSIEEQNNLPKKEEKEDNTIIEDKDKEIKNETIQKEIDYTFKVVEIEEVEEKNSDNLFEIKDDEENSTSIWSSVAKENQIAVVDNFEKDNKTENRSVIVKELEENKEFLKGVEFGEKEKPKNFVLPSLEFLTPPPEQHLYINEEEIDAKIELLLNKLKNFKIEGDVVRTYTGPVVTTFEFKPLPHIKVSKILNLEDDLAMALKASTIRIQAPIPGKDVVGIEIPNNEIETIYLREVLESDIFQNSKSPLIISLGKDIVGKPFVTDLAKLPHLLIAGTTGSGKSVGINAMILSLLYRNSPDDLKLMMIDPKMLEFSIYNEIPHLLTPVITEPKKAITGLSNMVKEMERRYKLLSQARVKNIENYNSKYPDNKLPYIVVIIDELADLMMTGGKDVEYSIARLAQMARASGIHLIVATQRPSVDVVTGLIKTNLPSRISFKVGQKIDSKVILDKLGAESLLGRGDMLFTPGSGNIIRLHAPFTTEEEIEKIVEFLKSQKTADYDENFLVESVETDGIVENKDELYEKAKEIIINEGKTSISYIQRRLQIGYNRAANIIEQLEAGGVLSSPNSKGQREILI